MATRRDYSGNTGDFLKSKIIRAYTLNYCSYSENSNKYYTIELQQGNTDNNFRVVIEYGRIGSNGKKSEIVFSNLMSATKEFTKIVSSKEKKGYVKVELVQSSTGSETLKSNINVDVNSIRKNEVKSSLDKRVQDFVFKIFEEANVTLNWLVSGSFSTSEASPLGVLSELQINKGRNVLVKIANEIDNHSYNRNISELSKEYWSLIPKKFGRQIHNDEFLIDTKEKISLQSEILDFYEKMIDMDNISIQNNSIDELYSQLKSDIIALDKNDSEYQRIEKKVYDTQSKYHNVNLEVTNIFSVHQKNAPEFNESIGNIEELWHGTRSSNIPAILSTHLKLPSKLKGVYITGAMFGPGLYFANKSTKSSQYSCSTFGGKSNKNKTAYLFLADVALGKIKEEYSSKYRSNAPKGYDSVKGCAGGQLIHDEFIIYNENQQRLKYIIEFVPHKKRK